MEQYREKFQALLRELFQFDCADLNFGIYRIMNHKRDMLDRFISNDLPKAVAAELDRGALAEQSDVAAELQEVAEQIAETLGKPALDADENLAAAYTQTPLGRKYLDLKAKAAGTGDREALEANIFSHLYAFFSRYYQDGDFISKRRYSKRQKYAIPYNGEEVYLYWANHDQYYVKSADRFRDYTFTSHAVTVHFKLSAAEVEHNNIKGGNRFFVLLPKKIEWNEKTSVLVIPFEFRPLTKKEDISYGKKNQQDAIISQALEEIPKHLKKADKAILALTAERRKASDERSVSYLEHHLRQYTRTNTSDFFIHKDLKGFLSRELDFYLKNEVLNLDDLRAAGEGRAAAWFQIMHVIKSIGDRIIDFLSQLEDFQKMLWEKRKFITEAQYCISVGNIDPGFYADIAACEAQWAEWRELLHIDEEKTDLFSSRKNKTEKRLEFLNRHRTLMLDTKHFDSAFVDRLLASIQDLDDITDGLLIHSENFQALSFIQDRYREQIKCVYIDPPYNTGNDEFIYKDNYQHSSWLTMIKDRATLARQFLQESGVLFSSIDSNEIAHLKKALEEIFSGSHVGDLVWKNATDNNPTRIAIEHEYVTCFARNLSGLPPEWKSPYSQVKEQLLAYYEQLKAEGLSTKGIEERLREFIKDNADIIGELERYKFVDDDGPYTGSESVHNPHPGGYDYEIRHPETKKPMRKPLNGYRFPWETMKRDYIDKDRLIYGPDEKRIVKIKLYLRDYQDSLRSVIPLDGRLGAYTLSALFGKDSNVFDNPKPVELLERLISFPVRGGGIVMDFFAGSGTTAHALINLDREDGGERKFILVEMADYFDTVLLPRIKKVAFTPEWKDRKPERMPTPEEADRSPRIVKYIRLESYEDALNNIQFDDASGQRALKFDDYLLKYMLRWETRASATLLNVPQLSSPFAYTLTIHRDGQTNPVQVDLAQTFNYLLGLHVTRRLVFYDDKRRYLLYRGRIDHREIVVIWRDTQGWAKADFERDRKFVAENKLTEGADEILVNGDSFISNTKALDPIFKSRMFSPVEA